MFMNFGTIGYPKKNIHFNPDDSLYEEGRAITQEDYLFGTITKFSSVDDVVESFKEMDNIETIKVLNANCDPKTYMQICKAIGGNKNFINKKAREIDIARHLHKIYKKDNKYPMESKAGKFNVPINSLVVKASPIILNDVEFVVNVNMSANTDRFYLWPDTVIQYNRVFYPFVINSIILVPRGTEANLELLKKNKDMIINNYKEKYNLKGEGSDSYQIYDNKENTIHIYYEEPNSLTITYYNSAYLEELKSKNIKYKIYNNNFTSYYIKIPQS